MADLLQRRGFLRGLTTLPLIGGGVTLIGKPTAAAVPVTWELLENYNTWLDQERRWLAWERAGKDKQRFDRFMGSTYLDNPAGRFHGVDNSDQPSSRAAAVLSAAGCALTDEEPEADTRPLRPIWRFHQD